MAHRRAFAAASLTALVAAGVVAATAAAPAGAQAAVPYRALADGTALELSLFGQGLTIGLSEAAVDGTPVATSHAAGALLPGVAFGEETADLGNPGDGQPTCSELVLPSDVPVLDLAVACGNATTTAAPGAASSAGVASLAISGTELLNDTPLSAIPVQATIDQLLGALAPVFDGVAELGLDAESLVSELLAGITQGGNVVTVELGPSGATAGATDASTTAAGTANGAVIRVIDRSLLSLPPVLTIEVGAAAASATAERATGVASAEIDPALVRVTVAPDIAAASSLPAGPIEVAPGQDLCLPLPDPLASCITAAGGRVVDIEGGGKRAESEGVSLRLLTGLPEGGIVLNLAAAAAEAAAVAPAAPVAPPVEAPRAAPLARTGADVPMTLAVGLAVLGVAGLGTVGAARRRAL
jgi:hypothetical protein